MSSSFPNHQLFFFFFSSHIARILNLAAAETRPQISPGHAHLTFLDLVHIEAPGSPVLAPVPCGLETNHIGLVARLVPTSGQQTGMSPSLWHFWLVPGLETRQYGSCGLLRDRLLGSMTSGASWCHRPLCLVDPTWSCLCLDFRT